MTKNKNKLNIINVILLIAIFLAFNNCSLKRSCNFSVTGKYLCHKFDDAYIFLEIKKDGSYIQIFRDKSSNLSNKGTWKKEDCLIRLRKWKDYNEKGADYEDYELGILFIRDQFLNITPDGYTTDSFVKEN